jgi:alcohol dehydrogenase, propanol-preferring
MRAAVLESFGTPLVVRDDVPEPVAGEGEALVRVRATGLCGTDLKLSSGALGRPDVLPIVPGHEVAGELVEAVDGLAAGQRVACYIYDSCGECAWCRRGRPTVCPNRVRTGLERDGGLAEYVAVPRKTLLPFSDSLAFEAAAVSMDAVASPWSALRGHARVQEGETVVVVGAGGLGLNGVQIARAAGAAVAVVDPVEGRRETALSLGAELAVGPGGADEVREWAGEGVDVAFEVSGHRSGFDVAVACLTRGGRLVACGYQPGVEYGLDSARLVLEEITVMGSVCASYELARDALAAVEAGELAPTILGRLALEDVNTALARLAAGDVLGRLVIEP